MMSPPSTPKSPEQTIRIDRLVRSRRRTIALVIERDGALVVRAPLHLPLREIAAFIQEKASWILRTQEQARQAHARAGTRKFQPGERFWYLGEQVILEILPAARPALTFSDGRFKLAAQSQPKAREIFVAWYRQQAREIFTQRVAELARQFGFQYQKLRVTSARTRWGSCSSRGTISLNWRLVMAPPAIIDYVIVHELVHLEIRKHSTGFYARLGGLLPNYQDARTWLKRHGSQLSID